MDIGNQPRAIIGLAGVARSGKDTIADILVNEFGFRKMAFADRLRASIRALNPIIGYDPIRGEVRVKDALLAYGYTEAKQKYPEYRRLLQRMGTEVGRKLFSVYGENFWVDLLMLEIQECGQEKIVIPDVRFVNEAEAIRSYNGRVFTVHRRGVDAVNDHVSEHDLDEYNFDLCIVNNGTIEDLAKQVRFLFS